MDFSNKKALVADDDPDMRVLLRKLLYTLKISVEEVADGMGALRSCYSAVEEGAPFDLVILDLDIGPGWHGDETAQQFQNMNPKPKLLLCTGSTHESLLNYSEEFGFDDKIEKPIDIQHFREIVSRLLSEE